MKDIVEILPNSWKTGLVFARIEATSPSSILVEPILGRLLMHGLRP